MKSSAVASVFFAIMSAGSVLSAAINDRHETACLIPAVEKWQVYRPIFESEQTETNNQNNPVWRIYYDPFRTNYVGATVSLNEVVIAKVWNIEARGNRLIFTEVRAVIFVPDSAVWKNGIRMPSLCDNWYLGKKGARIKRKDVYDIFGWRKEGIALFLETESGTVVTRTIKTN